MEVLAMLLDATGLTHPVISFSTARSSMLLIPRFFNTLGYFSTSSELDVIQPTAMIVDAHSFLPQQSADNSILPLCLKLLPLTQRNSTLVGRDEMPIPGTFRTSI